MASYSRTQVRYFNRSVYNNTDVLMRAEFTDYLRTPLLDKANDWICSVERFTLHTQGIPFQKGFTINGTLANGTQVNNVPILPTYTFESFLKELALAIKIATLIDCDFRHRKGGFVERACPLVDAASVEFPEELDWIKNAFAQGWGPTGIPAPLLNSTTTYPLTDIGDQLQKIIITTTLPIVSDTVGFGKTDILTDFSVPYTYSESISGGNFDVKLTSLASLQHSSRQQIQFQAEKERFLNLISPVPVDLIRIAASYQSHRRNSNGIESPRDIVMLPPGGLFSIKLAFFKRL